MLTRSFLQLRANVTAVNRLSYDSVTFEKQSELCFGTFCVNFCFVSLPSFSVFEFLDSCFLLSGDLDDIAEFGWEIAGESAYPDPQTHSETGTRSDF